MGGLEMRSIADKNARGLVEDLKDKIFNLDWVFSSAFDKLFLVAMSMWGFYNLWRLFF